MNNVELCRCGNSVSQKIYIYINIKYLKRVSLYDVIYCTTYNVRTSTCTAMNFLLLLLICLIWSLSNCYQAIWKPTTSWHNVYTTFIHAYSIIQLNIWQLRVNKCWKLFTHSFKWIHILYLLIFSVNVCDFNFTHELYLKWMMKKSQCNDEKKKQIRNIL